MTPAEQNQLVALFRGRRYSELLNQTNVLLVREPNCGFAWQISGAALEMQGKNGLVALRTAAQLLFNDANAHSNLGNALRDHGLFDDAANSYSRALQLNPESSIAYNGLGVTQRCQGRLDEAVTSYKRALSIKPDYLEAYNNLGNALFDRRQLDKAVRTYHHALEINPQLVEASDALLVALQCSPNPDRDSLFDAHKQFGERVEQALKPHWKAHKNSVDPDKRLKIGYVSCDFRKHAVAYFVEPILIEHDRNRFEIYCYSNSLRHDTFTDRLISETDHWRLCAHMTDDELSELIRADGVDILIDLTGHAAFNRLRTFARKPAPIQITYLGYPGTTGLTAMDYRLTDNWIEPEHSEDPADRFYTEKLIRLPNSLWCYRPHEDMPELTTLPALSNGYITFGSFNNVKKVTANCIALWAKLLHCIPTSKLLIATVAEGSTRDHLISQFQENGITIDRLAFAGVMPPSEFLLKLQEVDITLDPFPVNGATTTCESLWLGVPVLSLVGNHFLSRAGLSVMRAAKMQEFAVSTPEEFISIAKDLANDLPRLASIRANMREKLNGTPLLNQLHFTRNLENAYRGAWIKYASQNPRRHLSEIF
jgi:predicted O-linked N-acetylglucosamine transferase (SPINDLY family)